MEFLRAVISGIVEGITEWLPISSTGHLILLNEFIKNEGFTATDLYLYVVQLGAILAVVTVFFHRLNPFSRKKTSVERRTTGLLWAKVILACIPAAVIGLLLNDFMEKFETWQVVAVALAVYGVAFIIIERLDLKTRSETVDDITFPQAIAIGAFQVLSIIPGTSRSGSTIRGGRIVGCSRPAAAEFSFFLAIPVMFGVSFLKIVTYDGAIGKTDVL
ncbi:MAG: undecaprenyl-diphosphate phosphatase, partial [Clostridia bacterium]|nr:undecaprenyl-diphosphate phosphatase [Clostridia bacterium]